MLLYQFADEWPVLFGEQAGVQPRFREYPPRQSESLRALQGLGNVKRCVYLRLSLPNENLARLHREVEILSLLKVVDEVPVLFGA